ncbi:MAG: FAD-dependent oxidoreductase [Halioglobus sp.]
MHWAARWPAPPTGRAYSFRVLNRRKGPAVRATRAQADRVIPQRNTPDAGGAAEQSLFQQPVDDLLIENGRIAGRSPRWGWCFERPG